MPRARKGVQGERGGSPCPRLSTEETRSARHGKICQSTVCGYTGIRNFFGSGFVNSSAKPDFSGEWVLDRQASHLTGGASAMETGVLRIDHRDPKCGFQINMSDGRESVERA